MRLYTLTYPHPVAPINLDLSLTGIIRPADDHARAMIAYDALAGEDAWWQHLRATMTGQYQRERVAALFVRCLFPQYRDYKITVTLFGGRHMDILPYAGQVTARFSPWWWERIYRMGLALHPEGLVIGEFTKLLMYRTGETPERNEANTIWTLTAQFARQLP